MLRTMPATTLFSNRHIVVTGGTGALGSAVVARLIADGASCHIPVFDDAELGRFPYATDSRVRIECGVDLAEEAAVQGFFQRSANEAKAHSGTLWASIHIAGGFHYSPLVDTAPTDLRKMIDMNVVTCFLCCREAARHMTGQPKPGGRIVNVAARPALEPRLGANMSAYTAAKAGVAALTQAVAEELVPHGILVNAVAPSIMDTPANRRAMPDADHSKWPSCDDVASTIAFLASPANLSTRGGIVPVFGAA
ncbi:MAG: SDR family NAD(P)-dependent oxidoreductase [Phycisphaeraceae bacterium]|nr:SDR family NAD(P)-dependent oxidoreductase [Phycisphaeraceae bacterium]